MARLSGFETTKIDDKTAMNFLDAKKSNDYYKKNHIGFEINDGKFMKFIDDGEAADEGNKDNNTRQS